MNELRAFTIPELLAEFEEWRAVEPRRTEAEQRAVHEFVSWWLALGGDGVGHQCDCGKRGLPCELAKRIAGQ